MPRYGELSKDQEPSLPHQFCSDCIITTRGYDFREGQVERFINATVLELSQARHNNNAIVWRIES
jgi:hypothetical protein